MRTWLTSSLLLAAFIALFLLCLFVMNGNKKEIASLKAQAKENEATIEQLQKRPNLPDSISRELPLREPVKFEMPSYTIIWYPLFRGDIIEGQRPARLLEDFILERLAQNFSGGQKKAIPVTNSGFFMYIEHPPLPK